MAVAGKSKKLFNTVETCVDESIEGYLAMNPGLCSLEGHPRVVLRADLEEYKSSGRVLTLTGGGSGHEPAFLAYVGEGMMTGAVHGAIFASPGPGIILAALRALGYNHSAGIIVIFNNYTGDRLNFGIAVERARSEGIRIGVLINGDDCAIDTANRITGRRGLCGGIAIMKMVAALAEQGKSFGDIMTFGEAAGKDIVTLGVCLSPCSLPGGGPLFEMGPDDMEIGMGLHGEAGVKRTQLMTSRETVAMMLGHMTNEKLQVHFELVRGEHVAIILNNLGSTSDLEMNIIANDALTWLESRGIDVKRAYSGKFMASQEMQGCSISLIRVNQEKCLLLDAETRAPIWVRPFCRKESAERFRPSPMRMPDEADIASRPGSTSNVECASLSKENSELVYDALKEACTSLVHAEDELNKLDSACGDGDCGSTLKTGAAEILRRIGDRFRPGLDVSRPYELFLSLAGVAEEHMGGSSGAFYSLFLNAAAISLQTSATAVDFTKAFNRGVTSLSEYGGAGRGDRTMMDPLYATLDVLQNLEHSEHVQEIFAKAVKASRAAAEATATMTARAGRASYVAKERQSQPDPGAEAVAIILAAIYRAIYS